MTTRSAITPTDRRRGDARRALAAVVAGLVLSCGGCVVVTVADTAGTVAVKTVGLAADAAIGTAKVAGKVVGKAADAATGGSATKP